MSRIIFGKTIPQKLFRVYLLAIIIGSILLYLPISLQHGYQIWTISNGTTDAVDSAKKYTFWDALFVSCSALSTTGLTPVIISINYNVFGQVVIMILFELGGIGLLSVIYLIWGLFHRKSRDQLAQQIILQAERGNEKIAGTISTLRRSVLLILIIQIVFAILMSLWLCFYPSHEQIEYTDGATSIDSNQLLSSYHNYGEALWQGLFMSVAAINNAGISILHGGSSLGAFRNDWNVVFQIMVLIEVIIGGIGYPLIFDFWEKIRYKHHGLKYRVSLFIKICLVGFISVAIIGLIFTYSFEYAFTAPALQSYITNKFQYIKIYDIAHYRVIGASLADGTNPFGENKEFNKAFAIFFNVMTTRSAGFTTVSMNTLSPGSQWTYILLMFIGGSPASTASGIRTTTLIIAMAALLSFVRGRREVVLFHKTIPKERVHNAYIVIIAAAVVLCLFAIIIYLNCNFATSEDLVEDKNGVLESFFEAASAFGTVGPSMGITSNINEVGLVFLIILMFIGYLGVTTTLLSWTKKNPKGNNVHYPTEDVRIG